MKAPGYAKTGAGFGPQILNQTFLLQRKFGLLRAELLTIWLDSK
jgi:hypothetical protein